MSEWANHYISDIRAERDALRAKVARVEALAAEYNAGGLWSAQVVDRLRDALSGATPVPGSTESDPAVTTRQATTEGAGDGV
jgi:thioester reductase-like protein